MDQEASAAQEAPQLDGVIRPCPRTRITEVYPRLYRSSLQMRADAQKHYMEAAKASDANNGHSFWLGVDFPDSPEGCSETGNETTFQDLTPWMADILSGTRKFATELL